ncbi:MAG: PQQ-dependent sugar dehydrogenase [Gemmataceae bacterium]
MRSLLIAVCAVGVGIVAFASSRPANHSEAKRPLWTTSRIQGSPEPPPPYRLEVAFPKVKFFEPLEGVAAPGSDRLWVATRSGQIHSFVASASTEKSDLVVDLKKTVYGLALHPKFAENGYFYVTYLVDPAKEDPRGTRVARFKASGSPPRADRASEKIVFEWPSGGHNGGCLRFGPDGYLYIGTGDGSGVADQLQTGQNISDVLASLLRIDVDRAAEGRPYAIPADNPFIRHKGARPEVYAYGLRQPWKFSFDRKTGDLWCGDVGQDLWEMIYRVEKGGNYGWSVQEGAHPFRPERPRGPGPILPPVVEHHHADFRSITGGYVYHGARLEELRGAYIYGDYDTGRIWSLRYDGKKVSEHRELLDSNLRIVAFVEDASGEVYALDWVGGQMHRLVKQPETVHKDTFPRRLSETGLFSSTKDHTPAPGVLPYEVNAPLYSDGAIKERFLAIPGAGKIDVDAMAYPNGPGAPPGWKFPDGTVAVKTFSLETEPGNPASRRRLETRILHFEKLNGSEEVGDQYWRGYTYVWNDDQTDAELLHAGGRDRTFTIKDASAPGGERKQTWHFPSRAECTLCHTMPAKYVLGLNTHQLNRDHVHQGKKVNQLETWESLGLFSKPLAARPGRLPRLTNYEDESAPLDLRARAYLQANCAHCHMQWGGGNAEFQLLFTLKLDDMKIVGVRPGHGEFGLKAPHIVQPGRPERSLIYHRMKLTGLGRMPHVGSSVVDTRGARLIHDWIQSLPAR